VLSDTDLIADFMDNVGTVAALGASLEHAFQNLHASTRWRTVAIAGTSMPENFGGLVRGLHTIPRVEWQLWQRLVNAGLPFRVDYGDYATVALVPPPEGIAWGYPINVRYTLTSDFLICRGVGTTGINGVDMEPQLIGHAQSIVAFPQRGRIACWADKVIDAIAARVEGPGNLEKWVQISVNRHIESVRVNLP
jgi:hypothetical protein